jgi:hypothetical protein
MKVSSSKPADPVSDERESDVIVDFVFEEGVLYVTVANIGERPALKVSCRFEPAFHGLGGVVEISRLPLFRNIEYLAPWKEIRTLVDTSAAYFARKEPTKIQVMVTYRDESGARQQTAIAHDLGIYRDLAYVVPKSGEPDVTD